MASVFGGWYQIAMLLLLPNTNEIETELVIQILLDIGLGLHLSTPTVS